MTEADRLVSQMHRAGIGVAFTDDHRRCVDTLVDALGPTRRWPAATGDAGSSVRLAGPQGLSILIDGSLATFDDDSLTRLVIAAHQHRCRVEIRVWRPHLDEDLADRVRHDVADLCEIDEISDVDDTNLRAIDVLVTARQADGDLYTRHPGLDELIVEAATPNGLNAA